ncbi:hypothetical protein EZL74_09995 [Flavobacterium silvisoli]|uniref:DUF402 domain-containing protein n=1 Tax=Flavobacterium silvisoli TaxID=2529433 RepID=A0A4Q9YTM8_9FLAO|nr:hypothetical protein [Flavobacterium silvisoli]TBX66982.1 hypothetical protein EZL74_09995 [Flavobacterium silvisoli]
MKVNYKSKSGSHYIFTEKGLYRISNHWGRVGDCYWRLIPLNTFKNQNITVAFANWESFYPNDDTSKLFYIKVDFETGEVDFFHKESLIETETYALRNSKETAKIMRIIKEVLFETAWAKYLHYEDLSELRKDIVSTLIHTNQTFLDIKQNYLK